MDVAGKVGKGGMEVKTRGSPWGHACVLQHSWMGKELVLESSRINRSHEELIDVQAASHGSGAEQAGEGDQREEKQPGEKKRQGATEL